MSTPSPVSSPAQNIDITEPPKYLGRYQNSTFGFSAVIPEGFVGKGEPEPQPQHGFVISLFADDRATLSVSGNYNAALWGSLDEVYEHLYSYATKGGKSVALIDKRKDSMGALPAIRFTMRYIDQKTEIIRIRSEIISMRTCPEPDVQVVYTIVLDTPEHRFGKGMPLMEKVIKSWKTLAACG